MDVSLAPDWLVGFYSYSVFKNSSTLGPVPGEPDRTSSKNRGPSYSTKTQNGDFLENISTILIKFY
jgi:hypothetical protein